MFNVSYNQLTGTIPTGLSRQPLLSILDLAHNQLTGTIPPDLLTPSLTRVHLQSNLLEGPMPPATAGSALQVLRVDANKLSGTLPTSTGMQEGLQLLNVSYNNISGQCPPLTAMRSLSTLYVGRVLVMVGMSLVKSPSRRRTSCISRLDSNKFTGTLPALPPSVTHLCVMPSLALASSGPLRSGLLLHVLLRQQRVVGPPRGRASCNRRIVVAACNSQSGKYGPGRHRTGLVGHVEQAKCPVRCVAAIESMAFWWRYSSLTLFAEAQGVAGITSVRVNPKHNR